MTAQTEAPSGTIQNLTPDQEEKLHELWLWTLKLCGIQSDTLKILDDKAAQVAQQQQAEKPQAAAAPPPRRFSLWRSSTTPAADNSDTASVKSGKTTTSIASPEEDDKFGQSKEFNQAISEMKPEEIRRTLFSMIKHDHPDALLLRFLRARKWHVKNALVMMIATVRWRLIDMRVDDDLMLTGEDLANRQSKSGGGTTADKDGADFLRQIRMGKGFIHGIDRFDRPIAYIRVRLHKPFDQSSRALERFIIYTIESARLMLKPPVENAVRFGCHMQIRLG